MATCRCGQDYAGDLPWSDPQHDIKECVRSSLDGAESAYADLTYTYDPRPTEVVDAEHLTRWRETLIEGAPVYDSAGREIARLGKVVWRSDDDAESVTFKINP